VEIHNIIEDLVLETVNEIFDEASPEDFPLTHCHQCRLDVACYVLNRVKPEYLISGRGLVYYETDYQGRLQKKADLVALVNEGIRKVNSNRRPYYKLSAETQEALPEPPLFNFPAIMGRVLQGKTFEPVSNVTVCLKSNGELVPMIDYTWQNPYLVVESIRGNFTFLPRPIQAENMEESRHFPFELCLDADGFSPLQHFFELDLTAENELRHSFHAQHTLRCGELYLFPEDEPMEKNE
jgi:competence protein ComFB